MKDFNIEDWLNKKKDNNEAHSIINPINQITPNFSHSINSSNFLQEIENLVMLVESSSIDIAPTYAEWRDLGFALADALDENGREYFHRLSRFYPNYSYEETDKQYTACHNAHGHGITSKTIFHLAKQAGINIAPIAPITPIPQIKNNPKTSVEVFEGIEKEELISDEKMPTFYNKVKDKLPDFLKQIAINSISDEDADLLIL